MNRGRQKISFEGLLQRNVLSTFTVIRGFADLHDLATVSKAIPYQASSSGQVTGYQREQDSTHIEDIEKFLSDHPNSLLAPRRADKQKGTSYEIPAWIFTEIDQSRLVIADLTDERPNVYCEVGYAKSQGVPFILTFHRRRPSEKPPWDRETSPGNRVHFDLMPYRYIAYENPLELRDRLKQELDAFFEEAN